MEIIQALISSVIGIINALAENPAVIGVILYGMIRRHYA